MMGAGADFDRFSRRLVGVCLIVAALGGGGVYAVFGPAEGRGFAFGALGAACAVWVHCRAVAGSLGWGATRAARRARVLWVFRFILRAVPPCIAAFSPRFPLHPTLMGLLAVQVVVLFCAGFERLSAPVSLSGTGGGT